MLEQEGKAPIFFYFNIEIDIDNIFSLSRLQIGILAFLSSESATRWRLAAFTWTSPENKTASQLRQAGPFLLLPASTGSLASTPVWLSRMLFGVLLAWQRGTDVSAADL